MSQIYRLHHAPDNASLIVRIALEELGVPFEAVLVDRAARAQRSPAYLALNPLGMIPALETGDGVLFETAAIGLWLADRHGGLMPALADPGRADALKWLFFMSNSLHAGLRQMFYPGQFIAPEHAGALRGGIASNIRRDFARLDALVGDPACACLGPGGVSLLDIYVCVCLRWAQLYPADYTNDWVRAHSFPALHALAQRLELRASVQTAIAAEGLGPTPFSDPVFPNPPHGSAT